MEQGITNARMTTSFPRQKLSELARVAAARRAKARGIFDLTAAFFENAKPVRYMTHPQKPIIDASITEKSVSDGTVLDLRIAAMWRNGRHAQKITAADVHNDKDGDYEVARIVIRIDGEVTVAIDSLMKDYSFDFDPYTVAGAAEKILSCLLAEPEMLCGYVAGNMKKLAPKGP